MRIRIVLAAVVAMVTMSAAPASAATGYTFHSGGYNDDIFFNNPCQDTGTALKTAGTITAFECRYNQGTHLFDLYVTSVPFTFHSGGYNDDIFFNNPCLDTGTALRNAGTITTFECRWGSGGYVDLWVIV